MGETPPNVKGNKRIGVRFLGAIPPARRKGICFQVLCLCAGRAGNFDHVSGFEKMCASTFADRLRELQGHASGRNFAQRVGISPPGYRALLAGGSPTLDTLLLIASATGVDVRWLATGEGAKHPDHEATRRSGEAALDPELLGRVVDRIAQVYRDERVHLADVELGRLAATYYTELLDFSADPDERMAFMEVIGVRVRKALRAAAADPVNAKRQA